MAPFGLCGKIKQNRKVAIVKNSEHRGRKNKVNTLVSEGIFRALRVGSFGEHSGEIVFSNLR